MRIAEPAPDGHAGLHPLAPTRVLSPQAGDVSQVVDGISSKPLEFGGLGGQIAASGQGPTPEQAARMQALEKRLNFAEQVDFVMLAIAMLTMATARYWTF